MLHVTHFRFQSASSKCPRCEHNAVCCLVDCCAMQPQKTGKVRQVRFYDPVISETQFGSALASQNAEWVVVALANRLVVLDLQLGSSSDKR